MFILIRTRWLHSLKLIGQNRDDNNSKSTAAVKLETLLKKHEEVFHEELREMKHVKAKLKVKAISLPKDKNLIDLRMKEY